MAEKKHSVLALLDILTQYSDEQHILTMKELQSLLKQIYDLELERRTVYSNMDMLEQSGIKINRYEENGKGYYLQQRQFHKGEVLLMCNAIHASHFIDEPQSNALIVKLLKTLSKYEAKEFKQQVYMPNTLKTNHPELVNNIAKISKAIVDKCRISFSYLTYNQNKELVLRRKEPYVLEPRYIVYVDGRAYLIGTHSKYDDFIHYRIDRISKLVILDDGIKSLPSDMDAYEYAKHKLFMYSGPMQQVTFLCKMKAIDHMLDLFGKDVKIYPVDDTQFTLKVRLSYQGAIYLAQQYLDVIEIVQPQELRDEVVKRLKEALQVYA